jgi:hypothetical protein
MRTVPTEIIRTICSFTKEWRFLNSRWINISPIEHLKAPKKCGCDFDFIVYYYVKLYITSDKIYVLEYCEIGRFMKKFQFYFREENEDPIQLFCQRL